MPPSLPDSVMACADGAQQLVLFGSRAAGVARASSDWDVLLVHSGEVHVSPRVDLIQIKPALLESAFWLGSELAGHVAKYGIWLVGEPSWTSSVFVSERAIERKARRIVRRVSRLEHRWKILDPSYRRAFVSAIRRDVQRCLTLVDGVAVPPSRTLDSLWHPDMVATVLPTLCAAEPFSASAQAFLDAILRKQK